MTDLAVVIVSWNVRDLLRACLHSLLADLEQSGLAADVWVVDNASADGSPDMVAGAFPDVRLIAHDENVGFAAGNNLALRRILDLDAPPDHVWLLNPDTEVQPGATAALLAALEANPRAGMAGARLLYPSARLQQSAFRFPGLAQLAFELFPLPARLYETPLNGRYPRRLYEGDAPFLVDHPLGATMVVRREVLTQVGLMDETYRMYCEEIDWCWRIKRAGWRILCAPAARVVHHAGQSTGQAPVRSFVDLWTSRARLYARYHGPLTRRLARALVRIGMRRRMKGASAEMVEACRRVTRTWEERV